MVDKWQCPKCGKINDKYTLCCDNCSIMITRETRDKLIDYFKIK
jgi:hypothetical protein